jgi:hypothetical protein
MGDNSIYDSEILNERGYKLVYSDIKPNRKQPINIVTSLKNGATKSFMNHAEISQNFDGLIASHRTHKEHNEYNPLNHRGIFRLLKDYAREKKRIVPKSHTNSVFFDTRYEICPNNVSHLINAIVPCIYLLKQLLGKNVVVIIRRLHSNIFRSFLEYFEIDYWETSRTHRLEYCQLYGTRGLALYPILSIFDTSPLSLIPNSPLYGMSKTLKSSTSHNEFQKIFINRQDERALENSNEVNLLVQSYGFKSIYMEDFTPEEQFRIVANAQEVISIHGAGMAFMPFNTSIQKVIELFPPGVQHQFFPVLMNGTVNNYYQLIPSYSMSTPLKGWSEVESQKQKSFSVNLDHLSTVLAYE